MAEEKTEEKTEETTETKETKAEKIGEITHFFDKITVAIIKLSAPLRVGDKVKIKGATTDLTQEVGSIQLDHQDFQEAKAGDEVGIKVSEKVREGDEVFKG